MFLSAYKLRDHLKFHEITILIMFGHRHAKCHKQCHSNSEKFSKTFWEMMVNSNLMYFWSNISVFIWVFDWFWVYFIVSGNLPSFVVNLLLPKIYSFFGVKTPCLKFWLCKKMAVCKPVWTFYINTILKVAWFVQKLQQFNRYNRSCLVVKLHWGGSVTNRAHHQFWYCIDKDPGGQNVST